MFEKGRFGNVCSIPVLNLKECGYGQNKKMAKTQAAFKMLQTLNRISVQSKSTQSFHTIVKDDLAQNVANQQLTIAAGPTPGTVPRTAQSLPPPAPPAQAPPLPPSPPAPEDTNVRNPLGELVQMCIKRGLSLPTYEVGFQKGLPHERHFEVVCSVGDNLKESGSGKSSQMARVQAAHKMIQTLKSMPVEGKSQQNLAVINQENLAQKVTRETSDVQRCDNQLHIENDRYIPMIYDL